MEKNFEEILKNFSKFWKICRKFRSKIFFNQDCWVRSRKWFPSNFTVRYVRLYTFFSIFFSWSMSVPKLSLVFRNNRWLRFYDFCIMSKIRNYFVPFARFLDLFTLRLAPRIIFAVKAKKSLFFYQISIFFSIFSRKESTIMNDRSRN